MSPCYLHYLDVFPGVVMPYINPAHHIDIIYLLKLGWWPDIITEQLYIS